MLDTLQITDFQPYLNQTLPVRFRQPEATLPAELIDVSELVSHPGSPRPPFSIILRTSQQGEYYQQAIYTLLHPVKGELDIFLVPLGADEKGMRYQAIFN
ncbi:MAG: hypothetical protein HUU34_08900 [Saprospiraceae bacterium]|nr:hypothetical protein [Saprospiraceae bacterium]